MVLCSAACKKWGSLGTVVLQNTALYLTAHASLRPVGSPQCLGTVAALLTELLKAAVRAACVVAESDWSGLTAALRDEPRSLMAFAVPAACYSIHNNLWYVAVANLDPVTIAVTTQFKIVFAALFSRLLLGHRLDALRCCAVATLVAGSTAASFATAHAHAAAEPVRRRRRAGRPFHCQGERRACCDGRRVRSVGLCWRLHRAAAERQEPRELALDAERPNGPLFDAVCGCRCASR